MNLRRQVDTLRCGNRVVLVSAPFFLFGCVYVSAYMYIYLPKYFINH